MRWAGENSRVITTRRTHAKICQQKPRFSETLLTNHDTNDQIGAGKRWRAQRARERDGHVKRQAQRCFILGQAKDAETEGKREIRSCNNN